MIEQKKKATSNNEGCKSKIVLHAEKNSICR